MKIKKLSLLLVLALGLNFIGCKPKDADVKAAIEQTFSTQSDISSPGVEVKEGVATITGVCKDEATKAAFEKSVSGIKGVTSVVNNCTLVPPPMAVVTKPSMMASDSILVKGVKDATKDFPGVSATVQDGVISLSGEIKKSSLPKLMMSLNSLKPKKVENKLEVK